MIEFVRQQENKDFKVWFEVHQNQYIFMKKILLLCCLLLWLVSCNNDIDYSGTYKASKYETGNLQLFAKSGEITNSNLINNFVSRHQSTLSVIYGNWYETILLEPAKVLFLSSQEAEFSFVGIHSVDVLKKDNTIYLQEKDTFDTGLRYNDYPSKQLSVYDAMLKYREFYRDTFQLKVGSSIYGIRIRKCYYLIQSGSVINMPFLNYWYFQPYSTQYGGIINNVFDSSCIELFGEKDTLAIQQNQVIFKK